MKHITLALLIIANLFALDEEQLEVIKLVYDVAKVNPNKYGETWENTAVYIALAESSARLGAIGDTHLDSPSYGLFQFRLSTVRWMTTVHDNLEWIGSLSDKQIIDKLCNSLQFNVLLAITHINWLSERPARRGSHIKIVSGWNGGLINLKYYQHVVSQKVELLPYKDILK